MYTTTNVTFGYTPLETKDQLLERLIKENKITFKEAMILAEKEPVDYVQPYFYPVLPSLPSCPLTPSVPYAPYDPWGQPWTYPLGQPWTYPLGQPFYGGTCENHDLTDYIFDRSNESGIMHSITVNTLSEGLDFSPPNCTFVDSNTCVFTMSCGLN